ncbi:hypothetical protein GF322_03380 [Candidatus Dependentiae bacterium]|nr:hypothetical protein [Candidatus Dependentiae bacterium]
MNRINLLNNKNIIFLFLILQIAQIFNINAIRNDDQQNNSDSIHFHIQAIDTTNLDIDSLVSFLRIQERIDWTINTYNEISSMVNTNEISSIAQNLQIIIDQLVKIIETLSWGEIAKDNPVRRTENPFLTTEEFCSILEICKSKLTLLINQLSQQDLTKNLLTFAIIKLIGRKNFVAILYVTQHFKDKINFEIDLETNFKEIFPSINTNPYIIHLNNIKANLNIFKRWIYNNYYLPEAPNLIQYAKFCSTEKENNKEGYDILKLLYRSYYRNTIPPIEFHS